MKCFLPLLIILSLSFWLSCEDDTSAEETYSINGAWKREIISANTYTWMIIENEEHVSTVGKQQALGDTCYAFSPSSRMPWH